MESERLLTVPGTYNFRELGGYKNKFNQTIKWRKLLRSGELNQMTSKASKELDEYGLRYDIDLRSPAEARSNPDRVPKHTKYRLYPVYPTAQGAKTDLPSDIHLKFEEPIPAYFDPYLSMVMREHSRIVFRQMFKDLLANDKENESLLFHCAAGKDRTGIAAMLIMLALDVPYETIKQDYLLTNLVYNDADENKLRQRLTNEYVDAMIQKMNSSFTVTTTNIDTAYQAIMNQFGDFEHYFTEALELGKGDLHDLKHIYLE